MTKLINKKKIFLFFRRCLIQKFVEALLVFFVDFSFFNFQFLFVTDNLESFSKLVFVQEFLNDYTYVFL